MSIQLLRNVASESMRTSSGRPLAIRTGGSEATSTGVCQVPVSGHRSPVRAVLLVTYDDQNFCGFQI